MTLDSAQTAAANHFKGPAAVLAGPGSGKTTVITHRIRILIEEKGISPEQILVITFTKAAAAEMKSRFLSIRESGSGVTFGTFHAVFFMILMHTFHYNASDIVRPQRVQALIHAKLSAAQICVRDEKKLTADIIAEISNVKESRQKIEAYEAVSCPTEMFCSIYGQYQEMLHEEHFIDFADMALQTQDLFEQRTEILRIWQNRYSYILVDEFQDIAFSQYRIVKLLSGSSQNLFIVGDDDQSIYGFRGAQPQVMQQFLEDFKTAAVYHLNINYRSSANIVLTSRQLISHNKVRIFKDICTENGAGIPVAIHSFDTIAQEYEYLAEEVRKRKPDSGSCAVLTRTYSEAAGIEQIFEKKSVGVRSSKKGNGIFGHWIVQDLLAYIDVAEGSRERIDFIRIINKPERWIGRQYLNCTPVDLQQVRKNIDAAGEHQLIEKLDILEKDLALLRELPAFAAVNYIRKGIGYDWYIRQAAKERHLDEKTLTDILDLLQEHAGTYHTPAEWAESVRQLSGESKDKPYPCGKKLNDKAGQDVFFLTMHGAKGLEFDTVYLPDINEGITPYTKAVLEKDIEEERRLLYVAMTRAKKCLVLSFAREHYNRMVQPSRYIRKLRSSSGSIFYSHTENI